MAPFEYLVLLFAAIAGYLVWDEMPSAGTWTDVMFIAGAGVFMIYRSERTSRPATQAD